MVNDSIKWTAEEPLSVLIKNKHFKKKKRFLSVLNVLGTLKGYSNQKVVLHGTSLVTRDTRDNRTLLEKNGFTRGLLIDYLFQLHKEGSHWSHF